MIVHWLLVGGQSHGEAYHIKQGGKVACKDEIYQGENYLHDGRLYRIGTVAATTHMHRAEIPGLIALHKLKALA